MENNFTGIDTKIYGSPETPYPMEQRVQPTVPTAPAGPRAPVSFDEIGKSSSLNAQADAVLAENNRERAGSFAAIGAAITQQLPVRAYQNLTAPTFPPDANFDAVAALETLPFVPTVEQREALRNKDSGEAFQYAVQRMEKQAEAFRAMGDSPVAGFFGSIVDPGYLMLDAVGLGVGHLANVARVGNAMRRVGVGATVAAGTYALDSSGQEYAPIGEHELWLNALLNGAITGMVSRGGKMVQADPDFPSQRLFQQHQELEALHTPQPLKVTDEAYVGEVQVHADPTAAPLTEPRVAPTGEARPKVTYGAADGANPAVHDYLPEVNLGRAEQVALFSDSRVQQVGAVSEIADLVPSVRSGRTVIAEDAKAVYLPAEDRVFLVRDNIKPGDDVKGILLHEYGVHMSAERVLGVKTLGDMLNRIEDLALQGNARAKQAFADVPKDTPRHLIREEALGYYVERNHAAIGDSFVSRMVAGVRAMLRKSGLRGLKLSENDIMQLVRKAARRGKDSGSFDTAFPHVWHGSHVQGIESLDTAFVGSGEGAQAYGWGHYLTTEKGTALDYRNKESVRRGKSPDQGGLYRARINASIDQFIDLDARVQSPVVQEAFSRLGVRSGVTGKSAYEYLARKLGSQQAASEALLAEGVAGNKYATGRTRGTANPSSNFVVFDNKGVDMTARYSMPIANRPVTKADAAKTVAQKIAHTIEWSLHKAMANMGTSGKRIADILVDDALNMAGNAVDSIQRAIHADLVHHQYLFEDAMMKHMAANGYGSFKGIFNIKKTLKFKAGVERDVYLELLRRDSLVQQGRVIDKAGIPPHVSEMADIWDKGMAAALDEMKRAGVHGADNILEKSGYISRRWDISRIEGVENKLIASGMTEAVARGKVRDALSVGIQRANGWDAGLAQDVSNAILNRARAKGYFEDTIFHKAGGADDLAALKVMLSDSGIVGPRADRILEVMGGKVDEVGKTSSLKHRIDIAMDEAMILPDGSSVALHDLVDTNMTSIMDGYMRTSSTQAAFARKGYSKASDISKLREDFLHGIPNKTDRELGQQLFDDTIASLNGAPVGERVPEFMRNLSAVTRMIALANSALWQVIESMTTLAHYGAGRATAAMFKELPGIRTILGNVQDSQHLKEILTRNSSQDIRIRPFINKMEDGYELPISGTMTLALNQAQQFVPYVNAMKYVQKHQARTVANLIVNTLERAAKGDAKAAKALEQYGLEPHIMGGVKTDIAQHGMDTAKWSDATWDSVRGPLTKMMDDSVLKHRRGEIPAYAQHSSLGKFLFTFRAFQLASHNKVLAKTLNTGGFHAVGLLAMYQMPAAVLMTALTNAAAGKKPMTEKELVAKSFGQVSTLGLFSDILGIISGTKTSMASPGTMALDRAANLIGSVAKGDMAGAAGNSLQLVPLLALPLPIKNIGQHLKDN